MLNILFVSQPTHEYAQSQLYHGLVRLNHNVLDFPYNPTFHFNHLIDCDMNCKLGPCTELGKTGCLNHSAALQMPDSKEHLETFKPDCIITNNGFGHESLYQRFKDVPIACLDLGDSSHSSYGAWYQCIGRKPTAFFRRELHKGDGEALPLTFSFPLEKSTYSNDNLQKYNVSCMVRPTNPDRQHAINITKSFYNNFIGTPKYPEYLKILSESKFSFAPFGAAYTTVRYYEIAAMGSVIISPHFPKELVLKNDFTDDLNCIKYNNIDEVPLRIQYYLDNPDEYSKLRFNSFQHYISHHTTMVRAQEVLDALGLP